MTATADVVRSTKEVVVAHNGEDREFPYKKDELVGQLLAQAIAAFNVVNGPHLFGLFTLAGQELPDADTLHDAKVKAGEKLLLRQSTVRGG
jgi:hypothetical protein